MKTLSLLHTKAAAVVMSLALIAAACGDIDDAKKDVVPEGYGILSINVKSGASTKAYTDAIGGDLTVNNLQAIIFDENGNWYDTMDLTGTGNSRSGNKAVPQGKYTVVAVANGTTYDQATAPNLETLRAVRMPLASEKQANGLSRYGESAQVTVGKNGGSTSVAVNLLAFRVTLATITKNLSSSSASVDINAAFLENVWGTSTLSGTVTDFQNKGGRTDYGTGASIKPVISASTAYAKDLTYCSTNPAGHATGFYSYAKAVTNDQFEGPLASGEAFTRMVLVGSWKQTASSTPELVYYPVTIPSPAAGYSYDVKVTITNKGSDDPNKLPTNGALSVNVTISNWNPGDDIDQTF